MSEHDAGGGRPSRPAQSPGSGAGEGCRSTSWQLPGRCLDLSGLPLLMGIVNVTPDSFSDGGQYLDTVAAVEHCLRLEDDGAAILDIGGESTRPYSLPVPADEELRRVVGVLERLQGRVSAALSIDTSKSAVAAAALDLGVQIVNDVTGLTGDPDMLPLVVQRRAAVCAMHMQGTPQTMQDAPVYDHCVADIYGYLEQRQQCLLAAGVEQTRICLDPGIGFGKTHQHNLELLRGVASFHRLGSPLLVGYSRKGFIAKMLQPRVDLREPAGIGVGLAMARSGVQVLRVHDVAGHWAALRLFEAAGGLA
jgi:dihydropteroate synthase